MNAPLGPHLRQCRADLERGLLMFVARGWHASTFPDSMAKMLISGFINAKIIFSLTRLRGIQGTAGTCASRRKGLAMAYRTSEL